MGSFGWKQTSFTLPVCPGSLAKPRHHDSDKRCFHFPRKKRSRVLDATSFADLKLMSLLSNLSFMKLQEVNQYRRIEPLNICSFSHSIKTESWISQDEDILSRPVSELKHLHVPNIHLANTLRKTVHAWVAVFSHPSLELWKMFEKCQAGGTF